jgi:hypothetical protein
MKLHYYSQEVPKEQINFFSRFDRKGHFYFELLMWIDKHYK